MTDVSVEEITEETDSPADSGEAAAAAPEPAVMAPAGRPFPLNLSANLATAPGASSTPEPAALAVVKGRIKVADEVVEKVAALATLEVAGVADLGETPEGPAREGGEPTTKRGVNAHVQDRTVAVDVSIVAEYGHVVMEVANEVKNNVARTVSRMLGMRVVEVNVNVEDVRLPGEVPAES